jgi:hypothetical protein
MNVNTSTYLNNRIPMNLELGEHYHILTWRGVVICQFIKVTKCGFNFLNIDTSKCILYRHLYPSKTNGKFFVNKHLKVNKLCQNLKSVI